MLDSSPWSLCRSSTKGSVYPLVVRVYWPPLVVGLEVGPDVGPEVGPDVGLEVGLDVGLKVGR
jgi:hypothetical protein